MSNQSLTERVETLEAKVSAIEASHRPQTWTSTRLQAQDVFYKCGDRFMREGKNREHYLLSQTGEIEFNLIGLTTANRFTATPLILKGSKHHCHGKIPKSVFDKHFGTCDAWILVPKVNDYERIL